MGVEILLVASRYLKRDKLRSDGPLGLYVDLTFFFYKIKNISTTVFQSRMGEEVESKSIGRVPIVLSILS